MTPTQWIESGTESLGQAILAVALLLVLIFGVTHCGIKRK